VVIGSNNMLKEGSRCLAESIGAKSVADVAESRDIGRSPFSSSSLVERQGNPVELTVWLAYVSVITALITFPGPFALLCMDHGLRHGRRRSFATVAGGAAASLVLMALSSLGLGAALAASETGFLVLKIVGALYLIYLGIQAWRAPSQPVVFDAVGEDGQMRARATRWQLCRKGFGIGISNPKDLLFFGALFPNFIDMAQPQLPQFVALALTWLVVDLLTMSTYAHAGSSISRWFDSHRRVRLFNRTTGSLFVVAGAGLAASHR